MAEPEDRLRDAVQVNSTSSPTKVKKVEQPCPVCELCGRLDGLKICAACRDAWYCCREHQKTDWSKHKSLCRSKKVVEPNPKEPQSKTIEIRSDSDLSEKAKVTSHASDAYADSADRFKTKENTLSSSLGASAPTSGAIQPGAVSGAEATRPDPATSRGSSAKQSSSASSESEKADMTGSNGLPYSKEIASSGNVASTACRGMSRSARRKQRKRAEEKAQMGTGPNPPQPITQTMPEPADSKTKNLADYVVKCLAEYGICVVDSFLGEEKGSHILNEVERLHTDGVFEDGQLVSGGGPKQTIRGDQITWVERGDKGKEEISSLMGRLDSLLMACNGRFPRNGLGGRTKAMVACYPGSGTYYLRHVDNPNEDGRLITCIYYLNKNWEAKDGGVLRIFPVSISWVADIEPKFDRLLFFWSDRRNPHEVQAAHKQRFAITVWYFDKEERQRALSRYQNSDTQQGNARTMSTELVDATSNRA